MQQVWRPENTLNQSYSPLQMQHVLVKHRQNGYVHSHNSILNTSRMTYLTTPGIDSYAAYCNIRKAEDGSSGTRSRDVEIEKFNSIPAGKTSRKEDNT